MYESIRDVQGYPTSTDYEALWELSQKQSVVCLVDYQETCVDVAHTIASPEPEGMYVGIGARGISYVTVWGGDKAAFVRQCTKANVQWLVPQESLAPEYKSPAAGFAALRESFGDAFDAIGDVDKFVRDLRSDEP